MLSSHAIRPWHHEAVKISSLAYVECEKCHKQVRAPLQTRPVDLRTVYAKAMTEVGTHREQSYHTVVGLLSSADWVELQEFALPNFRTRVVI